MRTNTDDLTAVVRAALAAHLVPDGDAPPNYSAQLNDRDAAGGQPFHFLFRKSSTEVRSRSPRRVVEALLTQLGWYAREAESELLAVDALALVSGGDAVLLPARLRTSLVNLERLFNRAGWAVVDGLYAELDPAGGALVVQPAGLDVDEAALAALDRLAPKARRPEPVAAPGRYRLRGWVLLGGEGDGRMGTAEALLRVAPLLRNADRLGAQRSLEDLAAAVAGSGTARLAAWTPDAVMAALAELGA